MFSVERYKIMIKEKHQREVRAEGKFVPDIVDTCTPRKRQVFRIRLSMPVRRGVSRYVLETAKRLMQEYRADLDYLRDR